MSALAIQKSSSLEARDVATPDQASPKQFKSQLAKAKQTAKPATPTPQPDANAALVKPEAALPLAQGSQLGIEVATLGAEQPAAEKSPAVATKPDPATAEAAPAPPPAASAAPVDDLPPLTPLEQAVHDLIDQLGSKRDASVDDDVPMHAATGLEATPILHALPELDAPDVQPKQAVAPTHHVADLDAAAQAQPQSHVHLVIDEGDARIVMTVAVRGKEVHVSTRTADDGTAAAIARNANSLDHALRGRGLDLTELAHQQQHSEPDESRRQRQHQPRERKPAEQPRFSLEEEV